MAKVVTKSVDKVLESILIAHCCTSEQWHIDSTTQTRSIEHGEYTKCVPTTASDLPGTGVIEDVECPGDAGVDISGYTVEVRVKGEVDNGCKGLSNSLNSICSGSVKVYEGLIGPTLVGTDGNVEATGVHVRVYETLLGKDILLGYRETVGALASPERGHPLDYENSPL